jgi:hypothetical protein
VTEPDIDSDRRLGGWLDSRGLGVGAPISHRYVSGGSLRASGRAFPHIGATFGLSEAGAALRHVADGKAIGKVVLDIG